MIDDHLGELDQPPGHEREGQQPDAHQERGEDLPGDVAIQDRNFGDREPQRSFTRKKSRPLNSKPCAIFLNTLIELARQ